jgi:hypothetical protein
MAQQSKKPDTAKQDNDNLEEALEESFPASDPPSMTQPKPHADKPASEKAAADKPKTARPPSGDDDDLTRVDLYEDEDK